MIVCNVRNLQGALTGVQRYTSELIGRFGTNVDKVAPSKPYYGMKGHGWEQFVLPGRLDGRLLWSPSNSGPICVERQVVSIMDMSPLDNPAWSSYQFSHWYRFLVPQLVRRVRSVLTISEFSRQRILHYCPDAADKVHVTYLAAGNKFVPAKAEQVEACRNQLKIPTPFYIVALGSLEPRKNLVRLLQAWQQIHSTIPEDVWLVLAGARGKRLIFGEQSFEQLPARVHLTGHVPDAMLPALYSGALASVYLSVYEGFGLPPLEAMACGVPVLTSNVTSLPEVVGDAALTVDPHDAEAIGAALRQLIGDSSLRVELASRGVARASYFSWDRTAEQTWRVLSNAAQ